MKKKLILAAIVALTATLAGLRHPAHNVELSAHSDSARSSLPDASSDISELTQQQKVADYLHQHQRLPAFYLTKAEARKLGWQPARGDLCQALPGRAIGGDRFANRENRLPVAAGRRWSEADVNYQCGHRGSDRLLYSSDGLIYVTRDHYRHFQQVY